MVKLRLHYGQPTNQIATKTRLLLKLYYISNKNLRMHEINYHRIAIAHEIREYTMHEARHHNYISQTNNKQ